MNWHRARVTNGPTKAINNLVKRAAFEFGLFAHYRIRALLYAGKPKLSTLHDNRFPPVSEVPRKPKRR